MPTRIRVFGDSASLLPAQSLRATPKCAYQLRKSGQHFGRPGTPTDQAWIESVNGHLKAEYPHLLAIADPATLRAELAVTREHWNTVRLHAGIGYVTPNDEHEGRGEAIRKARQAGLEAARNRRFAWHRQKRQTQPIQGPDDVG